MAVFERLAEHFERGAVELRQLIEKQHAVVGEADFAGRGRGAAAHEAGVRDRVMRRAKRPAGQQRLTGRQAADGAVNARRLDRLLGR